MNATTTVPARPSEIPDETLTIRMAMPTDATALGRLAQLDSAQRPQRVPMLLAEVGGELRAALPLEGGRAVADPFRSTAELVAMLDARRRQVTAPARRRAARRWRLPDAPRSAAVPRA